MKVLVSKLLTVSFLLFLLQGGVDFSAQSAESSPPFDLKKEGVLGKVRLDQNEKEILSLLGQPSSKGGTVLWEAIGDWVQEWRFPAQDLVLNMAGAKEKGPKTVFMIKAGPNCKWATARGVKIGSTMAEVRKAYGNVEDKENSTRDSFVAGSIYGGVIFTLKNDKVTDIFIGAAAE